MTCSLFVPVLFACLRRGGRKPTALQVYRRATPPGVSGPHHQKKDQVQFSLSLRGGHRPTWQSASPAVLCTARSQRDRKENGLHHRHSLRSPRRYAPRNDTPFLTRTKAPRLTPGGCFTMMGPFYVVISVMEWSGNSPVSMPWAMLLAFSTSSSSRSRKEYCPE